MSATGGDRDSLLLIITVEDDVRCCLSMFRINFSWTKTAAFDIVLHMKHI